MRDIAKKVTRLVQPTDYYPLLVFQAGNHEVARGRLGAIQRDVRAFGRLGKGSGAQAVFTSALPIAGSNVDKKSRHVNPWLWDWCNRQNFGVFDPGKVYVTPGLPAPDGMSLS